MNMFRTWQDDFREMFSAKVNINSMADVKRHVERELIDGNAVRFEHLLKLYFYPEAFNYHGVWKCSVYSATSRVLKLKRTNRHPDKNFIMGAIWYREDPDMFPVVLSGMVHVIAFSLQQLKEPEHPLPPEIVDDCIQYLYNYHDWLATELSSLGFVTNTGVYAKIDELLSKSIYKK